MEGGVCIYYLELFCREDLFLTTTSTPLFIQPVIYLCQYEHVYIYFISWVINQYHIILLSILQCGFNESYMKINETEPFLIYFLAMQTSILYEMPCWNSIFLLSY